MKQIKLTPSQHNAIWTCVRYWVANSDDHGLYYLWWALGLGSREDNDLTPEEIESRDERVMKLISECLEILKPPEARLGMDSDPWPTIGPNFPLWYPNELDFHLHRRID